MGDTLTVDTTPQTEVLSADEQESLEIGKQMQAEQESLLAGKYKNAEELEDAYIELQKKLGSNEDEQAPEAEAETEETEESEPEEDIGTDILDRLWEESVNDSFTEETIQELAKTDPGELAKMHLEYRQANQQQTLNDSQVESLKNTAGGEKEYDAMMGWANDSLESSEIEMFDAVMDKGDPLSCFFAIQALKYRYNDANGVEGEMLTGKAARNQGDQFESQAQVIEAMNDSRYENDPAYRRKVMEKLERSDVQF